MKAKNGNVCGKVMVTGGAGFIGSHLAEELCRRGYHVTILDDLSTGKKENITHLLWFSSGSDQSPLPRGERNKVRVNNVEFIQGSITHLSLLQDVFQGTDYVFHQAALARVPRSIEDPLTVNEVNITGTLNILWAAKNNKVKKVIYASSSVYGGATSLPQREDMPPTHSPLTP